MALDTISRRPTRASTAASGRSPAQTSAWLRTAVTPWASCSFRDRKSTRLNSSHLGISYAVFCLEKKNTAAMLRHYASAVPCYVDEHRFFKFVDLLAGESAAAEEDVVGEPGTLRLAEMHRLHALH